MDSHEENVHLICESPLFRQEKAIVPMEALALQAHDVRSEQKSMVLPPITGGPAVQPQMAQPQQLKSITGMGGSANLSVAPIEETATSLTEPGVAPPPSSLQGGALAPSRRSLEQRRGEALDSSALTPAAFVEKVHVFQHAASSSSGGPSEPVKIEFLEGSLDGSSGEYRTSGPTSFKPASPDRSGNV